MRSTSNRLALLVALSAEVWSGDIVPPSNHYPPAPGRRSGVAKTKRAATKRKNVKARAKK